MGNTNVLVLAVFVAMLWGVVPVVHRYMFVHHEPPYYLILMVSCTVYLISVMLWILMTRSVKTVMMDVRKLGWRNIAILASTSFFALFIANIMYLHVVKHTSQLALANVIFAMYPIVTLTLAWLILKEAVTWKFVVGFILVLIGVTVMLTSKKNT